MLLKFITVLLILTVNSIVYPQSKGVQPKEMPAEAKTGFDRNYGLNVNRNSKEISELESKLLAAKQSANTDGVMNAQKDLDALTGSVTKPGEEFPLKLVKPEQNQNDNINIGFVSSVTGTKGIATCTEQVGVTAGRIWTSFVFGPNSGATPDQHRICYSDDGGKTWFEKVTLAFSTGNRMWQDQIDIELIENSSGEKFIWTAFGYATNNYAGQYRIGVNIVKITGALDYAGYTLTWPGAVNSNIYWKPRIVSDNEAYQTNPWVYITTCFDSTVAGGYQSGEKVAICYSPFTVSPVFTYKATGFIGLLFRYPVDYYVDITYYRNGGMDSILVVESSLEDSSKIVLMKTSISTFISSAFATYVGNISTIPDRRGYQAYIASAGGYNNLMIVNLRKYSETDWDIEYYRSTNGSSGWVNGYVDYRTNYSKRADIIGFRSAPGFYSCAYSENTMSFVPVTYCSAVNNVWGGIVLQMNHINTNPFTAQPRPGIKYGPEGESCFALWTEYSGGTNVWASSGCSGTPLTYKYLNFNGFVQGSYNPVNNMMVSDTLRLYLRNSVSPYEIIDSSTARVGNGGNGNFEFDNTDNFVDYYIQVKHRNSIETWSSNTIQFTSQYNSYQFSSAASQAYGDNMIQVDETPVRFAFFSGDVNQDGTIDAADISSVENDAANSLSGYESSDVTGDDFVDAGDVSIVENNVALGINVITP
ncbi:MAG: hypothetical protein IPI04_03670 [Ignavibacteria bacterium]|nr:hypothetical protein [Ignavibacteria bacterium]